MHEPFLIDADVGEFEDLDFAQVDADDGLLDSLGHADADDFAGDPVALLLLAYRDDVDSEPLDVLVELEVAVATVQAAISQRSA